MVVLVTALRTDATAATARGGGSAGCRRRSPSSGRARRQGGGGGGGWPLLVLSPPSVSQRRRCHAQRKKEKTTHPILVDVPAQVRKCGLWSRSCAPNNAPGPRTRPRTLPLRDNKTRTLDRDSSQVGSDCEQIWQPLCPAGRGFSWLPSC